MTWGLIPGVAGRAPIVKRRERTPATEDKARALLAKIMLAHWTADGPTTSARVGSLF